MITAEMKYDYVNARLGRLHDVLVGIGQRSLAAFVVEDVSRAFLSRVIALTPPKTLTQGQNAVAKDLNNLFTAVDAQLQETIGSKHGLSNVNAWFETSEGKPKQVLWDKIDPSGSGMEAFHFSNRNRRGRTRKLKKERAGGSAWYAPYVVTKEVMLDYRQKIQSHVGRKKAAWAISALSLGMKVRAWILSQIPHAKGKCINMLSTPGKPSVLMASGAPGVTDAEDHRIIQGALRYTYDAMGRQMKLLKQGIVGDWKAGVDFAKRSHSTGRNLDIG